MRRTLAHAKGAICLAICSLFAFTFFSSAYGDHHASTAKKGTKDAKDTSAKDTGAKESKDAKKHNATGQATKYKRITRAHKLIGRVFGRAVRKARRQLTHGPLGESQKAQKDASKGAKKADQKREDARQKKLSEKQREKEFKRQSKVLEDGRKHIEQAAERMRKGLEKAIEKVKKTELSHVDIQQFEQEHKRRRRWRKQRRERHTSKSQTNASKDQSSDRKSQSHHRRMGMKHKQPRRIGMGAKHKQPHANKPDIAKKREAARQEIRIGAAPPKTDDGKGTQGAKRMKFPEPKRDAKRKDDPKKQAETMRKLAKQLRTRTHANAKDSDSKQGDSDQKKQGDSHQKQANAGAKDHDQTSDHQPTQANAQHKDKADEPTEAMYQRAFEQALTRSVWRYLRGYRDRIKKEQRKELRNSIVEAHAALDRKMINLGQEKATRQLSLTKQVIDAANGKKSFLQKVAGGAKNLAKKAKNLVAGSDGKNEKTDPNTPEHQAFVKSEKKLGHKVDMLFNRVLINTNRYIADAAKKGTKIDAIEEYIGKQRTSIESRARYLREKLNRDARQAKNQYRKKGERETLGELSSPSDANRQADLNAAAKIDFSSHLAEIPGVGGAKKEQSIEKIEEHANKIRSYIDKAKARSLRGLDLSARNARAYKKRNKAN